MSECAHARYRDCVSHHYCETCLSLERDTLLEDLASRDTEIGRLKAELEKTLEALQISNRCGEILNRANKKLDTEMEKDRDQLKAELEIATVEWKRFEGEWLEESRLRKEAEGRLEAVERLADHIARLHRDDDSFF